MKKILGLLTSLLISATIVPASMQTKMTDITNSSVINHGEENKSPIIEKIDFSFYRQGPMSTGHTDDTKEFTLINYRQYANSWEEFTQKYQTLSLLSFLGQAGGQGNTVTETKYEIKTKDIKFNEPSRYIVDYDYRLIVCYQGAFITFTYKDNNGILSISARFYTQSANAVYNVWISLNIGYVLLS